MAIAGNDRIERGAVRGYRKRAGDTGKKALFFFNGRGVRSYGFKF